MDNPAYEANRAENPMRDETSVTSTAAIHNEKSFENHLYSDVQSHIGYDSCNRPTKDVVYEELHSENIVINECLYDTADGGEWTGARGHTNKDDTWGTVDPKVVYDSPLNIKTSEDNNCYSTLGSAYSQLQPYILKSVQQHIPPNEDEYSSLQHL